MRYWVLLLLLGATAPGNAADHNISAGNFFYSPRTITVAVGDTVHWSGLGSGHNVARSTGPDATAYDGSSPFYSGSPTNGIPTYQFTFNVAGAYYYVCDFHAGTNMKGLVVVVAPSPTQTPCATPSPTDSPSPTPTDSPTLSPTPTPTDTPDTSLSPTDSPTVTESFTVSPTATDTPSASPSATPTPSFSESPTISPSPTHTEFLSPTTTPTVTVTPTLLLGSFAGVEEARLLASPITGGILRYWARLTGGAQQAELRVYSSALTLLSVHPLGPQQPGTARWNLALPGLSSQPVWIQLRVQQDGRWRNGPVLRSYVLR
jgi:plastocyanin